MSDYAWYFKALELAGDCGELTRDQMKTLGVSDGDPQAGFYRKCPKGETPVPVAIWNTEGGMVAVAGGAIADPVALWTWVCRHPITEATYHMVDGGAPWPGEPPAAIGHNSGSDDPHEALTQEYQGESETATSFLEEPIKTQEQADKAAIWSKRLATIAKKATDLHKVEKQPSLDESRRVDDKWRDVKEGAADLSKRLKRHMDDFLREQARKEEERQQKARVEAELIRREADAAAFKAAQSENAEAKAEADRMAKQAAEADREAEARNSSAGRTGAKVALRTFVSAEITDYDALVMALKDRAEVRDLVQSLANRAAKSGVELAGMKITEERRAA